MVDDGSTKRSWLQLASALTLTLTAMAAAARAFRSRLLGSMAVWMQTGCTGNTIVMFFIVVAGGRFIVLRKERPLRFGKHTLDNGSLHGY